MLKTKIVSAFFLLSLFLFNFSLTKALDRSTAQIKEKEVQQARVLSDPKVQPASVRNQVPSKLPKSANFILVTDVLDGFGGQSYNGACDLSYFAGGQSSPIGDGSSTNYKLYAGFIYPTVVLCGDVNNSGLVELGDLVFLIAYLYRDGPAPDPYQAGDVNCDGNVALGDVVYLISYLYKAGSPPVC